MILRPSNIDPRRKGSRPKIQPSAGRRPRVWWGTALGTGAIGLMLLACSAATNAAPPPTSAGQLMAQGVDPGPATKLRVVTTTTLLADLARNVGGDLIVVTTLVPPGADAHAFQSTPSVGIAVDGAAVIISNGLGLDDFLEPLIANSQRSTAVRVVAAEGLGPGIIIRSGDRFGRATHQADLGSGANPHLWQDPTLAIHYVERIRDGLAQADPASGATYVSNSEDYVRQLRDLDQQIAQTLNQVPAERRHLVTFHDAFGYLARRYGWQASALVPDDAGDPTPGAIIAVIRQLREEGIPAVFAEPQLGSDVLHQAARDAGLRLGTIHSLPNNDLPTYLDMMRFNASSMAEHLK